MVVDISKRFIAIYLSDHEDTTRTFVAFFVSVKKDRIVRIASSWD